MSLEELQVVRKGKDTAIFPLAVPSIAGPGAIMTVMLLTDHHRFDRGYHIAIGLLLILILAVQLVLFLGAGFISRIIGESGANLTSRIMGLLLASIAANHVLEGIREYFKII